MNKEVQKAAEVIRKHNHSVVKVKGKASLLVDGMEVAERDLLKECKKELKKQTAIRRRYSKKRKHLELLEKKDPLKNGD